MPADIQAQIRKTPGVDRTIETSGFFFNVNTVFGQLPFVCFGVDGRGPGISDAEGGRLAGRKGTCPRRDCPRPSSPKGWRATRNSTSATYVADPSETRQHHGPARAKVKLVGILKGPTWMAFTSKEFADDALPFVPRSLLVTTSDTAGPTAVRGQSLQHAGPQARPDVLVQQSGEDHLRTSLASMYLIMHLVNGTVIFVVALMAGMLSNIYFTQRISEFAVLAAIGLRRSTLVWHAVSETAILTSLGWILGVLVNWGLLSLMQGTLFEPRGMLINPRDPMAYREHAADPGLHHAVRRRDHQSIRLAKLDPVTIIERR